MAKRSTIDTVYDTIKTRQSGPNRFITILCVCDQGDRVLLYGLDINYYIIAPTNCDIQVNDEVEYEPYGMNFGWFVRKVVKKPDWA